MDAEGRLTRFEFDLPSAPMTATYRDFGIKVDVTAPPAGEVADYAELMKGARSGNRG